MAEGQDYRHADAVALLVTLHDRGREGLARLEGPERARGGDFLSPRANRDGRHRVDVRRVQQTLAVPDSPPHAELAAERVTRGPDDDIAQLAVRNAHGDSRSGTDALSRSEEHTSELQSPCNLVCRLLLDKLARAIHQTVAHLSAGHCVVICLSRPES